MYNFGLFECNRVLYNFGLSECKGAVYNFGLSECKRAEENNAATGATYVLSFHSGSQLRNGTKQEIAGVQWWRLTRDY